MFIIVHSCYIFRISDLVFNRFKYPWYGFDFIFNNSKIGKEHAKCLKTIKDFTRKVKRLL